MKVYFYKLDFIELEKLFEMKKKKKLVWFGKMNDFALKIYRLVHKKITILTDDSAIGGQKQQ